MKKRILSRWFLLVFKDRDRFFIKKGDRKDYEMILNSKESPFKGAKNKVPFLTAILLGLKQGTRTKVKKGDGWIFTDYINDDEEVLIKSIAVFEKNNLNVLLDEEKVCKIAEEYAATGIKLLKKRIFTGFGSFAKKLESDLVDHYEKKIKILNETMEKGEKETKSTVEKKPRIHRDNPLIQSILHSTSNALEFLQKNDERHRQAALIEMDQAVEYALKAVLFQINRKEFMEKDWRHMTYETAMTKIEQLEIEIPNKSLLKQAHSARNKAQHRGEIASESWTRHHLKNVIEFLDLFCSQNLNMNIKTEISEELLSEFK